MAKEQIWEHVNKQNTSVEALMGYTPKPYYIYQVVATGKASWKLEESERYSFAHERQASGELQAGQPCLNFWQGDGAANVGNHFQACEGRESDQE